ncbi:class I SAM-dependent methyltransferase [Phenylobacterium soli]|uniref:Methyltransferase n=1 Tax=Phenylobacterium soli TaxID=2170551 RepID=A0A328AI84_9CAUL|nr:class I SAM-dependent methyltransferase [Phenylobacterium soli]RAK54532.1 methyltransferase [Phenylobacterium soli]
MTRRHLTAALAAMTIGATTGGLGLGGAGAIAAAPKVPANITAALADKARPEADVKRDAARHPGELLAWAGVKSGDKAVDFIMGGGYFTRILSAAVGPKGHVWAYQPSEFIKFRAAYGEEQKTVAGAYANVTPITAPFGELKLPDGVDLVLTVQNYHDLHLKPFPADNAAKLNAEIFRALKPGGTYVVVDHVGPAEEGTPDKLHRIDPAQVKKEVEAAGFKFVGETDLLRAKDDPHTANVFDPSIRGKTDQFAMKFRKP